MDAWNTKDPSRKTGAKNFKDTGLITAVLHAYKSKGTTPPSRLIDSIRRYIDNLRNPKARKDSNKKISDLRKTANLANTGNGPPLSSADQDRHDRRRASDKKSNVKKSDLRKRANQASTGNGPPLSSADQDRHDRQKAVYKKGHAKEREQRLLRRAIDQHSREVHESQATPVKPTDSIPIIRTGWFHYAFALAFLSLAFFRKKFDTDDFDLIKDIVPCLFHVSPVAPSNLQETNVPINDTSSVMIMMKSLLSSMALWRITIDGNGTPENPGIRHLQRGGLGHHWKLSEHIYAGPGLNFALRFFFRHWEIYYPLREGMVVYVYIIFKKNPAFLYFFQCRINQDNGLRGGIGNGCELLTRYKGDPGSCRPDACIEVTIGSDPDDPIGSSTFRLIRNNGNMDEEINFAIV
jgi:hypothetical protein